MPPQTRVNGRPPTSPLGKPDVVWGLPGQGGLLTEWAETVPDLMWPSSIRTYGRMRRDSKISAVLNAFFLPLLRATWAVDPAGVNQAKAVDVVAADLGLPVLGEKGPAPAMSSIRGFHWGEHLRLALLSYVFGFFPFERWYTTKTRDGLTHAAGIEERLPYTIDMIDLADNGQINTVSQNTQLQPIPANRFVWYAHEREGANWTGVSMLRSAYTPWILKHETLRVHATSIRRWGMGIPVVHAPPGGTPGQIAQAQQLASGMRAGDTAGAGLPDGFSFEVAGITGSIPDALGFLNFLNQEIASSALAAMLELGLSTGGSRALGDTFLDMFLLSLQAAANEIGNTASYGVPAMPGISRSLTDINFGEDEPCPRIVATDVGDRHEMTALAIQQLVACGAIQPDDTLEAFLRQEWSFPARTTPRTPPPPPKTPGQPGGAPGGGQPGPAGPPPNPQPPSAQPALPRPPAGPPGRRGGQPAISSAPAAAAAGLRRPMTATEAAAGLDPEAMRAELETATDRVLTQWMPVLTEQRHDLADQVTAAVDDGQLHHLATLAAPGSGGTDVLYRAMSAVAAQAAGRAVAEAAGQGITIDLTDVLIDHARLRQLAAARAALAGQSLAQAAARKALQVVTATAGTDAAREVTAVLHGLSPRSLADQLMAALHTAANEARLAVLAAGPEAVYTATELADDPNCCQPCKDIDGHQFASLDDARNAYANGAYIHCSGGLRCRGTVVATWPHTPLHLDVPGTGETWPHHLTPPPDLDPGVAAGYDPGEARDPHTGKWTRTGDATVHELARSGAHRGGNPASPVAPITAAEARDGSRAVSMDEFQQLAAEGRQHLERLRAHPKEPAGLDRNWDKILDETYAETRKSWGGATIDAHTGQALPQGADKYALTVKPAGLTSVSLPENATQAQFTAAMNEARAKFAGQLTSQQAYLGIFHDDDLNRVDIDPVLVVDTLREVETIGAYTHAIGGAYKFSDGNGYWPPHVADAPAQVAAAADGKPVPFKGPGQWRTQADEARQAALLRIHQDDGAGEEDDPGPKGDAARAAASTQAAWHFNPFQRRNRHGEWAGEDDTLQAPAAPHEPTADEARALSDDELAGAPGTPAAGERRRRADHSGNYVQLWHGTSRDNARSISRDGMHGTYSQDDPTLSPDRLQSRLLPYELNPDLHWPDNPAAVLDVRVPADQEDEYLYPPHGPIAARALRKPLPPEMIYGHQLEPYNDDGSNPQRAAAEAARGGWDETKHPRGYHGRFGRGHGPARRPEALDSGDRRLIADQLAQWAKTEKDSDLKTALGMVSDSYQAGDNHDAASRLRLAADRARQLGRPGDAGEMTAIAALIEKIKPAGGGEGYPGQYRDRLGGYWHGETDPEAKQNLNLAGAAYDAGQYDQAADLLRAAAGRVGPLGRTADRDNYNALAGAIEQQGQDNGVSHTTQALNALGTETDATSYGDVADQLSNARRAIDRAQPGTNWRTQAAGYLQTAADRATAHRDHAAARRYQNLASRVLRLPDTQAPSNTGLTALVGRAAPAVPRLLGGGDPRWNGKAGTFTPAQQPDYLGFTYPDGRIELRTDVVNGLLDTQAHPDKMMAEPDNLDVMLHELIHDTTGGRTAQDKKDWAALPRDEKNALGAINELDQRGDPSGRGNPVARTASDITRAHLWITRPQLDSLLTRGLMEKTGTSSATGGAPTEPDIRLTAKARRMLGADTTAADSDAYTSVTGHDAEEGFTELGATEHMEQFAGDTGFGQVMTSRLSVTPPGKPPALNQIYDAQQEVRALYSAAGKVGNPGTVNGPGSLEAYMALSNADHEISSPEPSPARFAGYLTQAYRAEPDPGVKARIAALNTRLGITGGATIDNPAYDQAKTDLISALRAEQRNLEQDGRPPQAQAARHLAAVITDTENDMPDEVGDVITEIQHLGDRAALAKTLRGKLDTLTATPVLKHDTVPEYARNLADPEKIRTGAGPGAWVNGKEWQGSWGHYPLLTANAQQWVQSAARAEHKTRVDQQGTAGYQRTVELTDEINREGTAGKLTAMTRQVLRSMGIDPDTADPGTLTAVRDEINATYGDPSSPGHGAAAAWKAARRTARRLAPAPRQPTAPRRRVSAPPITWKASAAPEDDEPDGVLPVTVTLTTAGAKAERIRAWAWADPRRLPQATAQIRQLATRTTDPAALRQVQDAGRSLATLTAIRQAPPATAAARGDFDPAKHPRKGKGEHGGGQFTRDGGTARPARPASSPRPETVAAALDKALASGVVHEAKPGQDIADPDERRYFGNTADTAIIAYADGSKWVRKRGTRLHPFTSTDVNHEVAYSRLAAALGIPAPIAIKHTGADGHPEMYEPYVNGIPAIEWAGGTDPAEEAAGEPLAHDPATMYNTPAGRMIGLADQIAGTAERHLGNWLVVGDHPVPIDNNDAGFNPFFGSITEFADYPMTQLAAEHPPAEWAAWQASLERLRPEYTQLGMTSEWRNVMANFAEAKRQAGVT